MDLELSDEQIWLEESINTLFDREWPAAENAWQAGPAERVRLWESLVEFGLLGEADGQLGAVELCLAARAAGGHLASAPLLGSVGVRYALAPFAAELPDAFKAMVDSSARLSAAMLEPGGNWSLASVGTTVGSGRLTGIKVAVEHAEDVEYLAVVARSVAEPVLALVRADNASIELTSQASLDASVPLSRVSLRGVEIEALVEHELARQVLDRLASIGGLLAAAEAVGAAAGIFAAARSYASERRQFGRTIASNQALRHLMADLHVRQASGWSTTLFAAAALDDGIPGAEQTASVAKAYVSRAAREIAHGAMQVFGGIAFTEEHPAHRFLRRIIAREQQFGDAAHHERKLGRALAALATSRPRAASGAVRDSAVENGVVV